METAQFAILACLSALSLAVCAYLLMKIRTITYLLEQPVVKKMSPQLKLKPVKIDDSDGDSRPAAPARNQSPAHAPAHAPHRGPRPGNEGGERPPRDNQNPNQNPNRDRAPRNDSEPRRDGFDRPPRNDRDRGNDRFGGRDRGGRGPERNDRQGGGQGANGGRDGGDRNRNRTESFSSEREAAPVEGSAPRSAPVSQAAAEPTQHAHTSPTLAPRRPLPSTVEHEVEHKEIPVVDTMAANAAADDALFNRDDSDIQHGRRNQTKKKPRFNVEEAATTEETKA